MISTITTRFLGFKIKELDEFDIVEIYTSNGKFSNFRNKVKKMVKGLEFEKGDIVEIEFAVSFWRRKKEPYYNILGIRKTTATTNDEISLDDI